MTRLRPLVLILASAAASVALALLTAGPALAGTANAGVPGAPRTNPLAGLPWGVYPGMGNGLYPAYASAAGANHNLLAKIATRPLAYWFGAFQADSQVQQDVSSYIQGTTNGNPNVLTQIVDFRLDPWEGAACSDVPSAADQQSYIDWTNAFARGIGSARVALILQPDLAFSTCAPTSVPLQLVNYAARVLGALPHTTLYVDAGVHYWPAFRQVVPMLEAAGIRYARGFTLNTTEYDSTSAELEYGARIVHALAAAGIRGKHFVINTAENGVPWLNGQYPGDAQNPRVCTSRYDHLCATLGIPPTTQVASSRWGLSRADRKLAARYADAYLWIGRPWLVDGAGAFDLSRALALAASTPF